MAAKRDYYEVLGVKKDADENTIKKSIPEAGEEVSSVPTPEMPVRSRNSKEVTEAYNVLSDKEKRKLYDQFGHAAF